MRQALFVGNGRAGYSEARVDEFKCYMKRVSAVLDGWRETHEPLLKGLEKGTNPKEIIHTLSEDLLKRFIQSAVTRHLRYLPEADGLLG